MVTIKNHTGYMWSIASSHERTSVRSTIDGYDQEAVKFISATIFPAWGTEFVAGGSYARVAPDLTRLPVQITLRADQVVATSEAIWEGIKFLVGFYAGINKSDEILAWAKRLITDAAGIDACIRAVAERHQGSPAKVARDLILDCGVMIGEAILKHLGEPIAKATRIDRALLRRIETVGSGIAAAFTNLGTRIDGLFQQVKGNEIRFTITVGNCLTKGQAAADLRRLLREVGLDPAPPATGLRPPARVSCQDGWALIDEAGAYHDPQAQAQDYPYRFGPVLARWKGDQWVGVYATLSPFDCGLDECDVIGTRNKAECRQAPNSFRHRLQC